MIKHSADASFLFAFNDDDENEETNYEEIRALSKRMKALGCTKVTESFSLKTNDATHIVCRSEEEYNSLWEESQNDADSFFELFHDEDDEKRAPPVKCTFGLSQAKVEEKGLGRAFEHLVPTTEDVGKDTERFEDLSNLVHWAKKERREVAHRAVRRGVLEAVR